MHIQPHPRNFLAATAAEPAAEKDAMPITPEEQELAETEIAANQAVSLALADYLVAFGRGLQHYEALDAGETALLPDEQLTDLARQTADTVMFGTLVLAHSVFQGELSHQRIANEQASPGLSPAAATSSRRQRPLGSPFLARLGLGGRP